MTKRSKLRKTKASTRPGPGRPTLFDPAFHPDDYVRLARLGRTKAQICGEWGIDRDTLLGWSKDKRRAELICAMKKGDELRVAHYTTWGLEIAEGKHPNAKQTMAIFMLKNICPKDFRDRIDHTHSLDVEDMQFDDPGEAA